MKQYTVIVVDDEALICRELSELIDEHDMFKVVDLCNSGDEALQSIKKHKPDIVFLDIQMPVISGLELAQEIKNCGLAPLIIFVTAYSQYAIDAFQVDAVNYIVKPFDETDISRVLKKASRYISLNRADVPEESLVTECPQKFSAENNGTLQVIDRKDIQLVYAKERLVLIRTNDGQVLISRLSLNDFESMLGAGFLRCHRNYIVNVDCIKRINTWFKRGFLLTIGETDPVEVPVSRNYVKNLRKIIQI